MYLFEEVARFLTHVLLQFCVFLLTPQTVNSFMAAATEANLNSSLHLVSFSSKKCHSRIPLNSLLVIPRIIRICSVAGDRLGGKLQGVSVIAKGFWPRPDTASAIL